LTLALIAGPGLLACYDDDGGSDGAGASDRAAVCRDVQEMRHSLEQIVDAAASGDLAALQDARQSARADIDALDSSARELEGGGGSEEVTTLRQDIQEFLRLLATPNLITVLPELAAQVATIEDDLDALAESAGCP
jgi:outer membrane murein-binding lipoprotein Lpp